MPAVSDRISSHASLLKRASDEVEDKNPSTKKLRTASLSVSSLSMRSAKDIKFQEECLDGVATPFIQAALSEIGKQLIQDASACKVLGTVYSPVKGGSRAFMKVDTSSCKLSPPSHILAVYGVNASKVTCYPVHSLFIEAHCPGFPTLVTEPDGPKDALPFIPCKVPCPDVFPLVLAYIYTLDVTIFKKMFDATQHDLDLNGLIALAQVAQGLWFNFTVLGMDSGKEDQIFRILNTFMADVNEFQKHSAVGLDDVEEHDDDDEIILSDTIFFTDVNTIF
ncbi:hypothetical protein DL96DRAFT_1708980 [Flagelloscypha sp. PMI_526]|nr:hypothetical protein DL96DRAFT_1708980 [Flagelloscypha sp. PMI_526]